METHTHKYTPGGVLEPELLSLSNRVLCLAEEDRDKYGKQCALADISYLKKKKEKKLQQSALFCSSLNSTLRRKREAITKIGIFKTFITTNNRFLNDCLLTFHYRHYPLFKPPSHPTKSSPIHTPRTRTSRPNRNESRSNLKQTIMSLRSCKRCNFSNVQEYLSQRLAIL